MIIRLFNLSKRENSTLRPSGNGTEFNCVLKSDTSIISPVILIDFADQSNPQMHRFNYAYIPDFARYYFISDIQSARGMIWEYTLTCDILATYRDQISGTNLYLTRCSSQYDGAIMDNYYPVKVSHSTSIITGSSPWISGTPWDQIKISDGCYILGIVSNIPSVGAIQYVVLDQTNMDTLIGYLLDANNIGNLDIDGMSDEAIKSVIDPLQFIKSCIWIPKPYYDFTMQERTGLRVWTWYASSVKFKLVYLIPPYHTTTVTFANIPAHPQASSRGSYLNAAPFSKYFMNVPPFGVIELDSSLTATVGSIYARVLLDLITGTGVIDVFYGSMTEGPGPIHLTSQIGVPIQLTQVYNDYISAAGGVLGGLAGGVASALTGNIAGAITGGVAAIGSAIDAMRPVVSSIGSNGGFAELTGQPKFYAVFYDVPEEDRAHVGRPLCQNVYMANLATGSYCLAMDGDIPIVGTNTEQQRLKEYLEGGFYYE